MIDLESNILSIIILGSMVYPFMIFDLLKKERVEKVENFWLYLKLNNKDEENHHKYILCTNELEIWSQQVMNQDKCY